MLKEITHRFDGRMVLDRVSLTVEPGRILTITGPSGGGKTTLLNIAAGLVQPEEGEVENRFQRTAYVFQEARLLPWLTAMPNIEFGLKALGVGAEERCRRAVAMAERLGLADALDKYPHQLSGGMRQRVSLGRALTVEPDLLLLDEPFSALDEGLRHEMQDLLLELLVERGLAAIFVTHDQAEAQRMGDEWIHLSANPARVVEHKILRPPGQRGGLPAKALSVPTIRSLGHKLWSR